ncbi:MAG: trypsin-like peptidase domain-containing protein [Armatimonadota bacterium]
MHDLRQTLTTRSLVLMLLVSSLVGGVVSSGVVAGLRPGPAEAATSVRELQTSFVRVAERIGPAVVNINTEQSIRERSWGWDVFNFDPFSDPWPPFRPYERVRKVTNLGSGFIISRDGYVLTNNHVIAGADTISVTLESGKSYSARLVKVIQDRDLAVIKIEGARDLPTVRLGDADRVKVGAWAIAVGSPFGFSETVTVGVISAKGRVERQARGRAEIRDLLQTDAAINPGNSGGPLLNVDGEVIGVNQAIFSPQGAGNIGIGFAIPMNAETKAAVEGAMKGAKRRV